MNFHNLSDIGVESKKGNVENIEGNIICNLKTIFV